MSDQVVFNERVSGQRVYLARLYARVGSSSDPGIMYGDGVWKVLSVIGVPTTRPEPGSTHESTSTSSS